MSKQPKSHLKRLTTFDYINSAILLLVAVCCVYPFLYVFFVATTDGTYLARRNDFLTDGLQLESFRLYSDKPALQCVRRYAKLFFIYCAGDTAGGSLHLRYGVRAQPPAF